MKPQVGNLVGISHMDVRDTLCHGIVLAVDEKLNFCTVALASHKEETQAGRIVLEDQLATYLYPAIQGSVWYSQILSCEPKVHEEFAKKILSWFSLDASAKSELAQLHNFHFLPGLNESLAFHASYEKLIQDVAELAHDCVFSILGGIFTLDLPSDLGSHLRKALNSGAIQDVDYSLAYTSDSEKAMKIRAMRASKKATDLTKLVLLRDRRLSNLKPQALSKRDGNLGKVMQLAGSTRALRVIFTSKSFSEPWEQRSSRYGGTTTKFTLIREEG